MTIAGRHLRLPLVQLYNKIEKSERCFMKNNIINLSFIGAGNIAQNAHIPVIQKKTVVF